MSALMDRVAAAPISWGVCEVPDWGYQLPPGQVLEDMSALGVTATEFGPVGFLPDAPAAKAAELRKHGLQAVGGFLPVMLHEPEHDVLPEVDTYLDGCIEAGAGVIVLAAFTGTEGYDDRPELDEAGWRTLLGNLDRIDEHSRSRGVVAALHPHVGTMIEREAEVERVLEGSRVGLCLDTGHLLVGGTDPVALTRRHADRVVHVHLKDVDASLAADVRNGKVAYGDAIWQGLFRPLGEGDVDLVDLVRTLEGSGYDGWYVLEQDIRLRGEPEDGGPVAGVRSSLDYLRQVAA